MGIEEQIEDQEQDSQFSVDEAEQATETDDGEEQSTESEQGGKEAEGEESEGGESGERQQQKASDSEYYDDTTYLDFSKPTLSTDQVKARIAAETKRRSDIERKYQEEAEARQKAEQQLHELKKPKEVEKPSKDLAYEDPDAYEQRLNEHFEAQQAKKQWEQEQQALQKQAEEAKFRETQEVVQGFAERAKKDGFDIDRVKQAAQVLDMQFQNTAVTPDQRDSVNRLSHYLLKTQYGHRLINDLSNDPAEVQQLTSLPYEDAVIRLNEKAQGYKQSLKSKAPPPDDPITGNGAAPKERGPKGATFE